MKEYADFLGSQPPYDALSSEELRRLVAELEVEYLAAGTMIVLADQAPLDHLWVVRSGAVEVVDRGRVVDQLGPGDTFGHISVLTGLPPALSVRALEGRAFVGLVGVGVLAGLRSTRWFVVDSLRFRRADLAWFKAWPQALVTGRFPWHSGRFDPGQRIANIALVLGLLAVTTSGVAMALLHGGPAFVWLVPIHTWSTYALVPLLGGHILIASGVLPGYRNVWRSMHLGGRLPVAVARRLWPGWTDEQVPVRRRTKVGGR